MGWLSGLCRLSSTQWSHQLKIPQALYSEKTLGRRVLTANKLNQKFSKYIPVAEESFPFLIRDKSNIYVFRQSAEFDFTFVS